MKTRIQSLQRPMAKGKHQRTGQRNNVRENPPGGLSWGQQGWTGTGQGVPQLYGVWTWDSAPYAAPPAAGMVRVNNATLTAVTHIFLNETQGTGGTGDPITALVVNDPLRIYQLDDTSHWVEYKITAASDAGAYRDYTVTYTTSSGGGFVPAPGMQVGIIERTGSPTTQQPGSGEYDPSLYGVDDVKNYVTLLPENDQRASIIQGIIDRERAGKNRSTLVAWLDQQTGVE